MWVRGLSFKKRKFSIYHFSFLICYWLRLQFVGHELAFTRSDLLTLRGAISLTPWL
jgi:hypothetical protein